LGSAALLIGAQAQATWQKHQRFQDPDAMHFWTRLGHIAIDMPLKSFQTSKTNLIMERWWISAYSNIILYGLPRSTLAFRCWRAQYQVLENLSG